MRSHWPGSADLCALRRLCCDGMGVCSLGDVAFQGLRWWVLPAEGKGSGTGLLDS